MTDTFFSLSKLGWLVLAPSNAMVLAIGVGLLLQTRARFARFGKRLFAIGATGLAVAALLPVGEFAVSSLEQRYPPLEACDHEAAGVAPAPTFAGVIVLGGALSAIEREGHSLERMGDAADRLRLAATIARTRPELPVLVSGGVTFATQGARSEAPMMAALLGELGVAPARILVEQASRTTAENARQTATISGAMGDAPWILVTSGFHMPRAMGAFQAAGVRVVAAPTDWRIDPHAPWQGWSASDRLALLDLAAKEYVGLLAYAVSGRLAETAPVTSDVPACY